MERVWSAFALKGACLMGVTDSRPKIQQVEPSAPTAAPSTAAPSTVWGTASQWSGGAKGPTLTYCWVARNGEIVQETPCEGAARDANAVVARKVTEMLLRQDILGVYPRFHPSKRGPSFPTRDADDARQAVRPAVAALQLLVVAHEGDAARFHGGACLGPVAAVVLHALLAPPLIPVLAESMIPQRVSYSRHEGGDTINVVYSARRQMLVAVTSVTTDTNTNRYEAFQLLDRLWRETEAVHAGCAPRWRELFEHAQRGGRERLPLDRID